MNQDINKYLSSVGINFPENHKELIAFEQTHDQYNLESNEESIDPEKILAAIKQEKKSKKKASNIDYHKRTVLAAEIVYQLEGDISLGHLKLQKLLFLCQHHSKMNLYTNFLKQAMGPYDPVLMRSIDTQFRNRKWFSFNPKKLPKYQRLNKCGEHQYWFNIYFSDQKTEIKNVIEIFRKFKTHQIELVGTLFACWMNALNAKSIISDQLLINAVYDWHKTKKEKFSEEQIVNAIGWMREKGIYPR